MPKVPVYQPQVQEQALRGGFQRGLPNADGGLIEVGRALNTVGVVLDREADRKDTSAAFNAENQIRLDWMETDAKLRKQYNGDNADTYMAEAQKWWGEAPQKYGTNLTPAARAKVSQSLGRFQVSAIGGATSFVESEKKKMLDFSYARRQDTVVATTAAQVTPDNAAATVEAAVNSLRHGAMEYAVTQGINDPDAAESLVRERLNQLHHGVLQRIVDQRPAAAREYLTKFGDQMTPATRAAADKTLEAAERNQEVLTSVASAMDGAKDETEALARVREKFSDDPEGMKYATAEIKTRYNEIDAATKKRENDAFDRAWTLAIDTGEGRRGVDSATWSAMAPQHRNAIEDELYQRQERARTASDRAASKAAEGPKTDWDTYAALRQKAISDPQGFKTMDLRAYFPKLGTREREALLDLKGKADKPDELKDVASLDQQIGAATNALDIKKESKGKLQQVIYSDIEAVERRTGKKLTQAERQQRIDYWLVEGEIPGFWNDREMRRYEAVGDKRASEFVTPGQKFVEGEVYTDNNGVRRRYVNGKWERP